MPASALTLDYLMHVVAHAMQNVSLAAMPAIAGETDYEREGRALLFTFDALERTAKELDGAGQTLASKFMRDEVYYELLTAQNDNEDALRHARTACPGHTLHVPEGTYSPDGARTVRNPTLCPTCNFWLPFPPEPQVSAFRHAAMRADETNALANAQTGHYKN